MINEQTHNPSVRTKKERLYIFDNLRGVGIILVVFAHLLPIYLEDIVYGSLYNSIYVFHMPLMFFVAGYFSKTDISSGVKAFKSLFIPYIFFSIIWLLFGFFFADVAFPDMPFVTPTTGLWFLLSLFIMKVLLPILDKIKYSFYFVLLIAILIGLIQMPDNIMVLGKTACFLPSFLLGFYLKKYNSLKPVENKTSNQSLINESKNSNPMKETKPKSVKIKETSNSDIKTKEIISTGLDNVIKIINLHPKKKWVSLILLSFLVIITVVMMYYPHLAFQFEAYYTEMGLSNISGMLMRLTIILSGLVVVILINFIINNKNNILTKIGRNSLAIYILHFFFTGIIDNFLDLTATGQSIATNPPLVISLLAVSTITIVLVLSMDIISNTLNNITKFFGDLFVKSS
jgi:fucose 4-O-acetylase-like acetyltransferase